MMSWSSSLQHRRWLALGGLAALVAALHGWLIERVVAARALAVATAVPSAALAASAVQLAIVAVPLPAHAAPAPPPPAAALVAPDAPPAAEPAAPERPAARRPRRGPVAEPRQPRSAASVAEAERHAAVGTATGGYDAFGAPLVAAASPSVPPPDADEAPTYRTRIPPPARIAYQLSRGGISGQGVLDWQPAGAGYSLRLEGSVPLLGTLITQTSRGGFDAAGLAPARYTDRRLRRGEQAANFQRGADKITFSGPSTELPIVPGVQDRVSVLVQLAAIANAWNAAPAPGAQWRIQVIGARGDANWWSLRYQGSDRLELPEGTVRALHFLREPESPYDTRAEIWLDPQRHHLPVRVRLTDGKRGDTLELLRSNEVP